LYMLWGRFYSLKHHCSKRTDTLKATLTRLSTEDDFWTICVLCVAYFGVYMTTFVLSSVAFPLSLLSLAP
jgi:hypothetical protein